MSFKIRIVALFLFGMLLVKVTYAQSDSIDIFIKQQMQKRRIPGLQLAIIKNGEIIKTGNYGLANLQDSVAVDSRTLFTINSITKAFTGIAIMQLVESGKINLSAPVSSYLKNLPDSWRTVTIQQLLSHISGLPDIVDEDEATIISPNGLEESWKKVQTLPMAFKPGEKFSYNQTNYLLLGRIIDTLTGMPFTEFITKEQLLKADMPNTIRAGFGATKAVIMHAAAGYQYRKGKLNNMFFSFDYPLQTAAGMSSTATEMANWVIALQNNQFFKSKNTLTALWTPAKLNNGNIAGFNSLLNGYAAGWPIIAREEHPAAAPVGGGRSAVFVYPNDNLSIIVLTNLLGGSPDAFIDEIAGFYNPDMKESNGFGLSSSIKLLRTELENSGYRNAITSFNKIKKTNAGFNLPENEVNGWGYKLIKQGRIKDAVEIFKLNVYLYPASANAFDSLGETFAELSDAENSIKNYEQSLKLNPENINARNQIQKLKANR
jgi:CubicO group peptidase (beta-lactamase class C family)